MSIQVVVHTRRGDITIWCQNRLEFLAQREQAERRGYKITVKTGMNYPDWLLKELINENSHNNLTCL
jgi:hypothetical protein